MTTTAITGLPYVGKTTLFNLLTGAKAATGSFAGAEGETNVGVTKVPDERLERLAALYRPKKITHAEITYRDLGLAHGAGAGEGISAKKLGELRSADALVHVVRAFRDPSVPHVDATVDPVRDVGALEIELLVADHTLVERRLERLESELRAAKGTDRDVKERERAFLRRALGHLDNGTPLRDVDADPDDLKLVRGFRLLTLLPQLVVVNLDESDVANADAALAPVRTAVGGHRAELVIPVCAKIEAEIAELPPAEAAVFRADLGLKESALERVVRATYELLGLISFFTVGDEDVHAWTIPAGTSAVEAAGAIHSDLERGFIRAEVIRWDDLLRVGSEAAAKTQGLMRTEGKAAQVADGEVVHVLFNVA